MIYLAKFGVDFGKIVTFDIYGLKLKFNLHHDELNENNNNKRRKFQPTIYKASKYNKLEDNSQLKH